MEIYPTLSSFVKITNQIFDLFFRWLESQCPQGHFQLFGLDGTWSAGIKQIESFFDFLFLWLA